MRAIRLLPLLLLSGCDCGGGSVGGCVDEDGDGFGAGCANGDDCRDDDPTIGTECPDCSEVPTAAGCPCDAVEPEICYAGPEGTAGVGVCEAGLRHCTDGAWGPCEGEVLPTDEPVHGRNGLDDDCDGLSDELLCGDTEDCNGSCCTEEQICVGAYCADRGDCVDDGDCRDDTRCVPGDGCVPYGEGETDEDCAGDSPPPLAEFVPALQCEWTDGIVWVPPIVVDLDESLDEARVPEIVFVGNHYDLVSFSRFVVAIDGEDCTERWRTEGIDIHDWSPIAAGDLEGDGDVEIAATKATGGLVVFDHEGQLVCQADDSPGGATPAMLANLDGEGDSEILLGTVVYDSACREIWRWDEMLPPFGQIPVVADVDLDGAQELVTGNRIFSGADGEVEVTYAGLDNGLTAVADFDPATPEPEIVVVAPSGVRIQTVAGEVVFGPLDVLSPAGESPGGTPTVADFDGDGLAEFGVAGSSAYVVFDPDCDGWARDGVCAGGEDGVLWQKATQDRSSGVTGSSVFDFDADGAAEVVYGDECFLRVYDGVTGETRFITPNGTGTAFEYPTIADVDGDGRAEIAVAGFGEFAGCGAADAETGEPYESQSPGVHVFRDEEDRWAPSRRIWNQHAYAVTNVDEDGRIPAVPRNNWEVEGLNSFRVNTTDDPSAPYPGINLTARGEPWVDECPERIVLAAVVSNRGPGAAPAGISVGFWGGGAPEMDAPLLCQTWTETELRPGDSQVVSCDWLRPGAEAVDVYIRVDDALAIPECEEDDNDGLIPDVRCEGID